MEISYQRVLRLTLALGAVGALAVLAKLGWRDAVGLAVGSALSYWSFLNFVKLAEMVGWSGKAPARGTAVFFALRYVLIGLAIYGMIYGLGSTPGVLIVGLLTSFVALVLELLWGVLVSRS